MAYKQSPQDKLALKKAEYHRKLHDRNIELYGTKVEVLRIVVGEAEAWDDAEDTLDTYLINNAVITKPFANQTRLFASYDDTTSQLDTDALDIWEYLPIEMKVPFEGNSDEAVAMEVGDMVVEILLDEHNNKLPLIFEVTKLFGEIRNKYITSKKYQLTLQRGQLPDVIRYRIDQYINGEI